jgi:hypothetical protein
MSFRNVRVTSDRHMSTAAFERAHKRSGFWWLRDAPGNFLTIGEHRGDRPLDITIRLKVGVLYTLGCGQGRDAIRQEVRVEADAAVAVMTVERALERIRGWIRDGSQIAADDETARRFARVAGEGAEVGKFLREQQEQPAAVVDAKLAPLIKAWANLNTGRDLGGILGA